MSEIFEMDSHLPREVADFALKIMECPVETGNGWCHGELDVLRPR